MANNNTLTERYLYAATRHLPAKMRADVEAELKTLIEDMLEERTGGYPPTEADISAVLEEMGNPYVLGQQYSPDASKSLVGPPLYTTFKTVLRIVLPLVAGAVLVSTVVQLLALRGAALDYIGLFTGWLGSTFASLLCAFAVVTIIFALLQHSNADVTVVYPSLKDLPDVPAKKQRISMGDSIAGIVFSFLFMALFLVGPRTIGMALATYDVTYIPLFNYEFILNRWLWVVIIGVVSIAVESFKLIEGRYTMRLALFNLGAGVVQIVAAIPLFKAGSVLNPGFLEFLNGQTNHKVSWLFNPANFSDAIFFLVVLGIVIDVGTCFYRARKYS